MVGLTRLFLFGWFYFSIFFISLTIQEQNEIKNFQGFSFLIITILLSLWIFSFHQDQDVTKELRQILYIATFFCAFTSLGSFLGFC